VLKIIAFIGIGLRPIGGDAVRILYRRLYIVVVSAFTFPSRGFCSAPMVTVLVEGAPFVFWPGRVYERDDSVEALAPDPNPGDCQAITDLHSSSSCRRRGRILHMA